MLSLDAIPFKFPSVNFSNKTWAMAELQDKVIEKQTSNIIISLAKSGLLMPLSLDIIGNPMGIFKNVGEGFKSIFVEPAKASVRDV